MPARSWKTGLAVLALVGGIGWGFASPYVALASMRSALDANDAAAVSERVDFPELRDSIRTQLTAYGNAMTGGTGRTQDLGVAMVVGMGLSALDQYVSPQGVEMLMQARTQQSNRAAATNRPAPSEGMPEEWSMERTGLTSFALRAKDGKAAGVAGIFTLDGTTWTLSGLDIPQEVFAQIR